jgi:hypothetical protein
LGARFLAHAAGWVDQALGHAQAWERQPEQRRSAERALDGGPGPFSTSARTTFMSDSYAFDVCFDASYWNAEVCADSGCSLDVYARGGGEGAFVLRVAGRSKGAMIDALTGFPSERLSQAQARALLDAIAARLGG